MIKLSRLNDSILLESADRATERVGSGPVWVVLPPRTLDDEDGRPPPAFGPVETLPSVVVTARFWSQPVREGADPILEYSRPIVVWFQADAVLSGTGPAPDVLNHLDWDAHAEDNEV